MNLNHQNKLVLVKSIKRSVAKPVCNISQTTMATRHRNLNYSLNASQSYRWVSTHTRAHAHTRSCFFLVSLSHNWRKRPVQNRHVIDIKIDGCHILKWKSINVLSHSGRRELLTSELLDFLQFFENGAYLHYLDTRGSSRVLKKRAQNRKNKTNKRGQRCDQLLHYGRQENYYL